MIKKLISWALAAVIAITLLAIGLVLMLSRPERVGMVPGSLRMSETALDGRAAVVLYGNSLNRLGVLQGVSRLYTGNHEITVQQYRVRWHPFSELIANSDWPVVMFKDNLQPGTYRVRYWDGDSFSSAGTFTVPIAIGRRQSQ